MEQSQGRWKRNGCEREEVASGGKDAFFDPEASTVETWGKEVPFLAMKDEVMFC